VGLGTSTLEPVLAEVVVGDVIGEDVPAGDEDRVGHGLVGLGVTDPAGETMVLRREVGAFGVPGGGGRLGEKRSEPLTKGNGSYWTFGLPEPATPI